MSDDDMYDDDFESDQGESPRRSLSPRLNDKSPSPLMPIIEVPSEVSASEAPSAIDTEEKSEDESIEEDEEEATEQLETSAKQINKQNKGKVKNGKQPNHVDMTPPDTLLKKSQRKAKKYSKDKNKADEAIKELIRCTALARIVYGDGHWKLANSYVKLAEGYFDLKGYYPQAQQHAEFAKSVYYSRAQMSSPSESAEVKGCQLNIHYILGRALTANKKLVEASNSLSEAERIAKGRASMEGVRRSEQDEWSIKINMALARLNARQQKYALATTYFERALETMKKRYGPDSTELIPVYQSLGKQVEQCKGELADHEKAIEFYLQAHSIASACYKDNSVEVAETAVSLAMAYSNVGDEIAETSAESYLNDALTIYQMVHGPDHEKTLEIQDDLARLLIRTDKQDEGLDILKSTIDHKKEVFGDLSAEVADTWKLIGSTYLSKGDTEKALRALKKCHNIECAVYGTNSKKSKDTQRTMDILLANPNLASKQKKTKSDELKDRPRFNSTVSRSGALGGFKPQTAY